MRSARVLVTLGLMLTACGEGTGESSTIDMGKAGSGGSGGSGGGLVIGDLSGQGGGGAGGMSGGTAGGTQAGSGGSSQNGGSAGSNAAGMGQGGRTFEPCEPASPQVPFAGSCLYEDNCTDQYDASFGADTLKQICEGQSGVWSTGPCVTTTWAIKCTQEVFGGVYIQYLPPDGFCFDGCEQPL